MQRVLKRDKILKGSNFGLRLFFSKKDNNAEKTDGVPSYLRFKNIFNYAFPLVCLVGFILLSHFALKGFSVALRVSYSGEIIGYVESGEVFNEAYGKMEQRMVGVEDLYPAVKAPVYTTALIRNSSFSTVDELCNKMLKINCDSLTEATGAYYGTALIGVTTDKPFMEKALDEFLQKRDDQSDTEGAIEFSKEITYQSGLYPSVSVMSTEKFYDAVNTPYSAADTYKSSAGDTFEKIAEKFNMDYSELITLNYEIYSKGGKIPAGTAITVKVPRYRLETQYYHFETYTQTIEHGIIQKADSGHYIGFSSVSSEGEDGLETVTVKVVIKDKNVTDKIITDRKTLKEPVDEVITIGTKSTGNVSYLTKYLWPTKETGFFISAYYGDDRNHKGLDIATPVGTEIFAADEGTVTNAGYDEKGYGYYVIITHKDGYKTLYGHCSVLLVSSGDAVDRGDLIAYSGNTGNTTGPHLHFEVRYNGDRIDPAPFLGINPETGEIKALEPYENNEETSGEAGNSNDKQGLAAANNNETLKKDEKES